MIQKTYLIDDDEFSLFINQHLLELEQFSSEIKLYDRASEAVKAILDNLNSQDLPQVIFLDLNMPEMDGWEFLDALAPYEKELKEEVNIYILTSSVDPLDKARADTSKLVAGFIEKPLSEEVIKQLKESL